MKTLQTRRVGHWSACHIYYHEDLERLLDDFVVPVVGECLRSGSISQFFYIRYFLGGPHVRLRVRHTEGSKVQDMLAERAEEYLSDFPSKRRLPIELVEEQTARLLASDPDEHDDRLYPDNHVRKVPFDPEVERYGGIGVLAASLDFFTVSSMQALAFLNGYRDKPRSQRLIPALRLALRQAWGFALAMEEIEPLVAFPIRAWGEAMPVAIEKGNRVFDKQGAKLTEMVGRDLRQLARHSDDACREPLDPGSPQLASFGARALREGLIEVDQETCLRVGTSQIHMTANRLGLINGEEVYLAQLLVRCLEALRQGDHELWQDLDSRLLQRGQQPALKCRGLLANAITGFLGTGEASRAAS